MASSAFYYFAPSIKLDIPKIGKINVYITLLLFISLVIPFYFHIFGFYQWGKAFEKNVFNNRGEIAIEDTGLLTGSYAPYNWGWTNPSLSAVLRGDRPGAIINNQKTHKGWQPGLDANAISSFKKYSMLYG